MNQNELETAGEREWVRELGKKNGMGHAVTLIPFLSHIPCSFPFTGWTLKSWSERSNRPRDRDLSFPTSLPVISFKILFGKWPGRERKGEGTWDQEPTIINHSHIVSWWLVLVKTKKGREEMDGEHESGFYRCSLHPTLLPFGGFNSNSLCQYVQKEN